MWVVWRPIICNILFPHYPNIEDKKQRVLLRLKGFLVNLKHDTRHNNCWYFFEAEGYCLIYMAKVPSVSRLIHSITINNIRSKRRPNRALLKENIRQNMCASIIVSKPENYEEFYWNYDRNYLRHYGSGTAIFWHFHFHLAQLNRRSGSAVSMQLRGIHAKNKLVNYVEYKF